MRARDCDGTKPADEIIAEKRHDPIRHAFAGGDRAKPAKSKPANSTCNRRRTKSAEGDGDESSFHAGQGAVAGRREARA